MLTAVQDRRDMPAHELLRVLAPIALFAFSERKWNCPDSLWMVFGSGQGESGRDGAFRRRTRHPHWAQCWRLVGSGSARSRGKGDSGEILGISENGDPFV